MKKMWEATLDRPKLYNLHTEAGMEAGGPKRAETKDVHLNQPVTGIKPRIYLLSPLLILYYYYKAEAVIQ